MRWNVRDERVTRLNSTQRVILLHIHTTLCSSTVHSNDLATCVCVWVCVWDASCKMCHSVQLTAVSLTSPVSLTATHFNCAALKPFHLLYFTLFLSLSLSWFSRLLFFPFLSPRLFFMLDCQLNYANRKQTVPTAAVSSLSFFLFFFFFFSLFYLPICSTAKKVLH